MADMTSLGAALGTLNSIWGLLGTIKDTAFQTKLNAELSKLNAQLFLAQQQALEIQAENKTLRKELDLLRDYRQHHSVIWRNGVIEDGPFCPACLGDGREQRLIVNPDYPTNGDVFHLYCPKNHHQPSHRMSNAPGPYFTIPKSLVAEDYFSMR